jgi:extracellular factor (EF) 3-hydroxypalmitic acid methyl ester biosynthesis protein
MEEVSPIVVERLNAASVELSDFASRLSDDQHTHYRAYFRTHVMPLLCASPLLRRAYEKPLGYAGDYEMMNMLYRDHAEGESLFGKVINIYGAQEPAARANINRLEYLGKRIRELTQETDGRVRIASIGCGPAREITKLLSEQPALGPRLEIALIDQEDRAIAFAERTLGPLAAKHGARVQFIKESVRRLLTTKKLSAALGERDFIYSAGLFDYLNQRSVAALMAALYEALVPGGQLAIGNVAAHNPTRFFMEYALDWFLIHRSPEDLLAFAGALEPAPARMMVDAEPLGVNLFLRLWK